MTRKLVITDINSGMAYATAMFGRIKSHFSEIHCQDSIISKGDLPSCHHLEVVFRPGSPHHVIMREVSNAYVDDVPAEFLSYSKDVANKLKSTVFYIEAWIQEQINKQLTEQKEELSDTYQVF